MVAWFVLSVSWTGIVAIILAKAWLRKRVNGRGPQGDGGVTPTGLIVLRSWPSILTNQLECVVQVDREKRSVISPRVCFQQLCTPAVLDAREISRSIPSRCHMPRGPIRFRRLAMVLFLAWIVTHVAFIAAYWLLFLDKINSQAYVSPLAFPWFFDRLCLFCVSVYSLGNVLTGFVGAVENGRSLNLSLVVSDGKTVKLILSDGDTYETPVGSLQVSKALSCGRQFGRWLAVAGTWTWPRLIVARGSTNRIVVSPLVPGYANLLNLAKSPDLAVERRCG